MISSCLYGIRSLVKTTLLKSVSAVIQIESTFEESVSEIITTYGFFVTRILSSDFLYSPRPPFKIAFSAVSIKVTCPIAFPYPTLRSYNKLSPVKDLLPCVYKLFFPKRACSLVVLYVPFSVYSVSSFP